MYKKVLSTFLLFIFLGINISYGIDGTEFIWSTDTIPIVDTVQTNSSNNEKLDENISTDLNLESESAILIEQNSGKVLYEHNAHEKLKPASVTKIMSILLIMEAIDSGRISYEPFYPQPAEGGLARRKKRETV